MIDQPKKSGAWIKIPVVAVLLLVLYVLSIGPAVRYHSTARLKADDPRNIVIVNLYVPINWVCDRSMFVRESLEWYTNLWRE